MRAVVLSYIGVAARMYLWPTAVLLAVASFTPLLSIGLATGVAAMGLAAMLCLVAFSLLVVPAVKTEHCSGWVIPNFIAVVILLQMLWLSDFFARTATALSSAAALTALGLVLLCTGAAILPSLELDFQGPESNA